MHVNTHIYIPKRVWSAIIIINSQNDHKLFFSVTLSMCGDSDGDDDDDNNRSRDTNIFSFFFSFKCHLYVFALENISPKKKNK